MSASDATSFVLARLIYFSAVLLIALSVFVAAPRTNLLDSMLSSFSLSEAILNVLRIEGYQLNMSLQPH